MAIRMLSAASGATIATSLPSLATIEAKQFAGRGNRRLDQDAVLVDAEPNLGLLGELIEHCGKPSTRRVAHNTQV